MVIHCLHMFRKSLFDREIKLKYDLLGLMGDKQELLHSLEGPVVTVWPAGMDFATGII